MTGDSTTSYADQPAAGIQAALVDLREGIYLGRGKGISKAAWRRNTSLRSAIGGVPTATLRERAHLATTRARSARASAEMEGAWAAEQFRGWVTGARANGADPGRHGTARRPVRGWLWLGAGVVVGWALGRRQGRR